MSARLRKLFPWFALALAVAAVAWAVSFGTLPPADFTFDNSTEIKTVDPPKATGQPEGRIIDAVFEGLLRHTVPPEKLKTAKAGENLDLSAEPASAESYTISEDGRTYTFQMRKAAKWSDGSPVTAHDFAWSWRRMLHPETASEYAYQLHYLQGAEQYTTAEVKEEEPVEVELDDRPNPLQTFPRGTIVRGTLTRIEKSPEPQFAKDLDKQEQKRAWGAWRETWIYWVTPEGAQEAVAYCKQTPAGRSKVTRCLHVLPDFEKTVGIQPEGDQKLVLTLKHPTPYFPELLAFYPLFPVNRRCVETFGSPNWTKPENLVSNGPYRIQFRRIRDRIRLVKNESYWNAESVQLKTIDALAIKSETTALNMYLSGQIDWATTVPKTMIPEIQKQLGPQFRNTPMLTTYFYRLNVNRPPLDNVKVRQALSLALDRRQICEHVTKAGEVPARGFVPPGLTGYPYPQMPGFDPERAQKILAEAGYPGGRGLPRLEILYNVSDAHQEIAEVIQQQWRENLGIDVQLRNLEWGVFLDTLQSTDFQIARSGWIGDYPDPNTFVDMFVTGGANNQTNWSNARYDELVEKAGSEFDPPKRLQMLADAEQILLDEQPIIPIYWAVTFNLVKPDVRGFYSHPQDWHPLQLLSVEKKQAALAAGPR
jgi:oligopeptide transport system substrate-binding protein